MKSLFILSLIPLFIPAVSDATWKKATEYNLKAGEVYHNKGLHLYQNQQVDSLLLTGSSFLTVNGNSLLNNAVINNKSRVHLYTIDPQTLGYPVITNTQINNKSTLIMETGSVSSGQLFIARKARLNIIHVDDDSINPFINSPKISGNISIANLNLAGRAFIGPTETLADEYDDWDYQQQPGTTVITRIDSLTMQPGSLLSMQGYIPNMQFNQLHINTLSGNGDFTLSSHLAGGISDKIAISGHASGHFGLSIEDSGYEPDTPERVDVISVNSGDAHFDLLNNNGIVEAGVWQYTLQQEQNEEHSDWYLSNQPSQSLATHNDDQPESSALSLIHLLPVTEMQNAAERERASENLPVPLVPPSLATETQSEADISRPLSIVPIMSRSAQAVMNMASASRHILATEMSTFRQRMGDATHYQKKLSLWTRYLNDASHHANNAASSFHTHLQGLQMGIDTLTEFNSGHWLLGTFISDSKTTVRSGKISNGNIRSQSGSLYATWLDHSGFYWDNVLKINHLHHKVGTEMNNGQTTKGRYRQHGLSIASEAGYPINLTQMLTLMPYGKVSYFRTSKVNHTLDNGLAATLSLASSMSGETGLLVEMPLDVGQSHIRPYFKTALVRELTGDNTLTMNGTTLNLPDSGAYGKYGLGSILQIADNVSAWVEVDYRKGKKIESPVNTSLGIRISF